MGSSRNAPTPPSPDQLATDALRSQISLLPEQLAAEQQYAPQFGQVQLDLLKKFAPQLVEQQIGLSEQFGNRAAEAQVAQRDILAPEARAGQDAIINYLGGNQTQEFQDTTGQALKDFLSGEEVLTPAQEKNLQQDIREGQNVRGFGIASPLGSLEEARQLEDLRQQIRGQRLNAQLGVAGSQLGAQQQLAASGLSAAGRAPVGVQQFNPQTIQGQPSFTQQLGPQGYLQGSQLQYQGQLANRQNQQQFGSAIGGLAGGLAGSFIGQPFAGATIGSSLGGLL